MKATDVEFYTKPFDEVTLEEIGLALDLALQTVNRCSVTLRQQGFPVGRYEPDTISGQLLNAYAAIHRASHMARAITEDQRGTVSPESQKPIGSTPAIEPT